MMSFMTREKRRSRNRKREEPEEADGGRRVSGEVLRGVSAVFFIALSGFLVLAGADLGGVVGSYVYRSLSSLLGVGYLLLPLSLILLSIAILRSFERRFGVVQLGSMTVFLLAALGLVNMAASGRGGVLGTAVANPIVAAVDAPAAVIFLLTFIVAALIVAFNVHLGAAFSAIREWMRREEPAETAVEAPVVGLPEDESEPLPAPEAGGEAEALCGMDKAGNWAMAYDRTDPRDSSAVCRGKQGWSGRSQEILGTSLRAKAQDGAFLICERLEA